MNQLVHVCRVCLVERKKMFTIERTNLQGIYEMVAQTQLIGRELPAAVCYLCYSQLRRCERLVEFAQESEKMLKLIILFGTKAETVAKAVSSRLPLNLKIIEPVLLSIPDITTNPYQEIKTEVEEFNGLPLEDTLEVTMKEVSSNEKEQITITKEQIANEIDIKEEDEDLEQEAVMQTDKENEIMQIMFIKQQIDMLKQKIANQKEQLAIEKEQKAREKEQLAIEKEQKAREKEQLAIEKEQKAKEREIKAIEEEQVRIKQELIAEGEALEEEALSVSVKQEIDLNNVKMEEMELDSVMPRETSEQSSEHSSEQTSTTPMPCNPRNDIEMKFEQTSTTPMPCNPRNDIEMKLEQASEQTNITPMPCNPRNDIEMKLEQASEQTSTTPMPCNPRKDLEVILGSSMVATCVVCERGFSSVERRDAHMHKHREATPYACVQCRRGFLKKQHIESHMKIHMSLSALLCNICDAQHAAPGALALHMRAHVSERHWCCHTCKKRYRTVDALRKHLQTHPKGQAGVRRSSATSVDRIV